MKAAIYTLLLASFTAAAEDSCSVKLCADNNNAVANCNCPEGTARYMPFSVNQTQAVQPAGSADTKKPKPDDGNLPSPDYNVNSGNAENKGNKGANNNAQNPMASMLPLMALPAVLGNKTGGTLRGNDNPAQTTNNTYDNSYTPPANLLSPDPNLYDNSKAHCRDDKERSPGANYDMYRKALAYIRDNSPEKKAPVVTSQDSCDRTPADQARARKSVCGSADVSCTGAVRVSNHESPQTLATNRYNPNATSMDMVLNGFKSAQEGCNFLLQAAQAAGCPSWEIGGYDHTHYHFACPDKANRRVQYAQCGGSAKFGPSSEKRK